MALRADHDWLQPDRELAGAVSEQWWDSFEPPPGMRAEIIRGELVLTPSPGMPHAVAATRLTVTLCPLLPDGFEIVQGQEWKLAAGGFVAMAPIPDLVVVDPTLERIVDPPLLAIEILSRSDRAKLTGTPLSRIEGKLIDYAANGLQHYLEIDLRDDPVVASRYQLERGRLVVADEAIGDETLVADAPFHYEIRPSEL